jgi:hypothetical protein
VHLDREAACTFCNLLLGAEAAYDVTTAPQPRAELVIFGVEALRSVSDVVGAPRVGRERAVREQRPCVIGGIAARIRTLRGGTFHYEHGM